MTDVAPASSAPRRRLRAGLSLLLGVALLWLLARSLDPAEMARSLRSVDPALTALALVCYLGSYLFRALRFRLLIHSRRPPLLDLLGVVTVHNLMNMLLPMRTGELSYVYLTKQRYGVSLGEGAASLLLARVFDMVGILVFFVTALLVIGGPVGEDRTQLILLGALLLGASLIGMVSIIPLARLAHRWIDRLATRLAPDPTSRAGALRERLLGKGRRVVAHLEEIRRRRTARWVFLVTEAQWFCTFLTCFVILRAQGIDFPFERSVLGSTGLSVALILPINSFANVGTFEAGWIAGYRLSGMEADPATVSAIVAHVLIVMFAVLLALAGRALLSRTPPDPA